MLVACAMVGDAAAQTCELGTCASKVQCPGSETTCSPGDLNWCALNDRYQKDTTLLTGYIKSQQDNIDTIGAELDELATENEELKTQRDAAAVEIAEKDAKIVQLNKDIGTLGDLIVDLNNAADADNAANQAKIAELQAQIAAKNKEIEQLSLDIAAKNKELEAFNEKYMKDILNVVKEYDEIVATKDAEIAKLNKDLEDCGDVSGLNAKIAQLEKDIVTLSALITQLNEDTVANAVQIKELQAQVAAKNQEIAELKVLLQAEKDRLAAFEAKYVADILNLTQQCDDKLDEKQDIIIALAVLLSLAGVICGVLGWMLMNRPSPPPPAPPSYGDKPIQQPSYPPHDSPPTDQPVGYGQTEKYLK